MTPSETSSAFTGAANGAVRRTLQLEGLALCLLSMLVFHACVGDWSTLLTWFLLPDVAFLAYLIGPWAGALCYNLTHSLVGPWLCLGLAFLHLNDLNLIQAGLIWACHIGFDRALGYGLKYGAGFRYTHLGRIGRDKPAQAKTV